MKKISNPQGAVFHPPFAWVLTESTEELLRAEAENRAIFITDLDKIAATLETRLAPPSGMIHTIVERERDRVICLKDPVFKTLELAMTYAGEHPGAEASFIANGIGWANGKKITWIHRAGNHQQLLDGKFLINRDYCLDHRSGNVRIVSLIYDVEFIKSIKKNKARQRAAQKHRAKVKVSQVLIPPSLLKVLVSSFAASIFHHDLKVQFAWNSGVTRESLIPEINKLVKIYQKLKLSPVEKCLVGYRNYHYTQIIESLKEFIPGLIAHENLEYQVFGKWLRKESRRLHKSS